MTAQPQLINITETSIPFIGKDVVIRNDHNGKLIFQISTDEMYFVSDNTYSIIQMMDGSITIQEILEQVKISSNNSPKITEKQSLYDLILQLEKRKVIEVWE